MILLHPLPPSFWRQRYTVTLDASRSSRSGLTPGTPNADRKTTTYNEQDRKIERSTATG